VYSAFHAAFWHPLLQYLAILQRLHANSFGGAAAHSKQQSCPAEPSSPPPRLVRARVHAIAITAFRPSASNVS
jgi:hypothetical protein